MKVLIISHLALNNTNNVGKTLAMLFKNFERSQLAQLYFNPISPNENLCDRWYRITDEEIIRSLASTKKAGSEITFEKNDTDHVSGFYKRNISRKPLKLLARDILWKIGRINWTDIRKWLDEISPEIIFLAPGYSIFPYRIAKKISLMLNIPLVLFIMDDFYNENKNKYSLIELIRRKWLRKTIQETVSDSRIVYSCSEELSKYYSELFGKKIETLYTPCEFTVNVQIHNKYKGEKVLVYGGSVQLNRWRVIAEIGKCICENGYDARIQVYAPETDREFINRLLEIPSIEYGGFISADELKNKISNSDIVIHVEAFDDESFVRTKYSISTKIPEYLASGKVFIAVGPKGQASMNYLKKHNAAIVFNSIEEMNNKIGEMFDDDFKYEEIRCNAECLIQKNHTSFAAFSKLNNDFENII